MTGETPILKDPEEQPTEEVIFRCLDRKKALWVSFFAEIHANHPGFSEQWRYYQDGKNWLMKVTRKSKTVFWLSVCRGCFQTTFYLSDKAEELIEQSDLPTELKESFIRGKRYGKIRGVTLVFRSRKDIDHAETLIAIRLKT